MRAGKLAFISHMATHLFKKAIKKNKIRSSEVRVVVMTAAVLFHRFFILKAFQDVDAKVGEKAGLKRSCNASCSTVCSTCVRGAYLLPPRLRTSPPP